MKSPERGALFPLNRKGVIPIDGKISLQVQTADGGDLNAKHPSEKTCIRRWRLVRSRQDCWKGGIRRERTRYQKFEA
ncbi:MAG: hypothetical protein ACLRSW_12015 [Christensenellaceae bacterium]